MPVVPTPSTACKMIRARQTCFCGRLRAFHQHHLGIGNKPPHRDLADPLLVERGLGAEVEAFEIGPSPQSLGFAWETVAVVYSMNDPFSNHAQQMDGHESTRKTNLYDRRSDKITLDEVERIAAGSRKGPPTVGALRYSAAGSLMA
jgi:hypothetical protein